jgi:hypothetical protein
MTNKKMTNAMALETAIEVMKEDNQYDEVVEKLQKMLVQVNKKSSLNRKPTATQVENENLKGAIVEYLDRTGKRLTVSEMMKEIPELANLSNQRVTSLVTALYSKNNPENRVIDRAMDKRKAVFFMSEPEEN